MRAVAVNVQSTDVAPALGPSKYPARVSPCSITLKTSPLDSVIAGIVRTFTTCTYKMTLDSSDPWDDTNLQYKGLALRAHDRNACLVNSLQISLPP